MTSVWIELSLLEQGRKLTVQEPNGIDRRHDVTVAAEKELIGKADQWAKTIKPASDEVLANTEMLLADKWEVLWL